MRFRDWKLVTKQFVGFSVVLVIMALANGWAIQRVFTLKSVLDDVSRNWLNRIIAISEINRSVSDLRLMQLQYVAAPDDSLQQTLGRRIVSLIDRINVNRDDYESLQSSSSESQMREEREAILYEGFDQAWDTYQTHSLDVIQLRMTEGADAAIQLLQGKARITFDAISDHLLELVGINRRNALAAADQAEESYKRFRTTTILLLVGTIALSMVFAWMMSRLITRPVKQLADAAGRVADGDLNVRVALTGRDEIGDLAGSFDQMTAALKDARDRQEQQAATLREQRDKLQAAHRDLETKNRDLEDALRRLREAQEQLLLKEKMAGLGHLVAGVSHELNSPTGALISSLDVSQRCVDKLAGTVDGGTPADSDPSFVKRLLIMLRDNVGVTRVAGERIRDIVTSLRSFARLDEADYQVVNVHEGIDSSLTLLGKESLSQITVTKEYGDLPRIGCYPSQLNQVFYNLLQNSIDAIDGSGQITIRTSAEPERVIIQITDNGQGISKQRLAHIFDIGFADKGSRIKMGSGLSTSYNIVQHHKGDIAIESAAGEGTTVTVALPINRP